MSPNTYKVIVVDDEDNIKDLIKELLTLKGHKCFTASNGKEALEKLSSDNFDSAIIDIVMPEMDGITLTKEILKKYPDIAIMVMTGFADYTAKEALDSGASDFINKPFNPNEFLMRFYKMMHTHILIRQAMRDPLTGALNRRQFNIELYKEIQRSKRYKHDLSMIIFDVDRFKEINDSFGHQTGDYVLQEIGKIVRENIRLMDVFARYGGDEFVILMPEANIHGAIHLAGKLKKSIEEHEFQCTKKVSCSFGVSQYYEDESEDDFIKRADKALYEAKNGGRNRIVASSINYSHNKNN